MSLSVDSKIKEIMKNPEAVEMMEKYRINQLPVVNADGELIGALNMHDLFRAKAL